MRADFKLLARMTIVLLKCMQGNWVRESIGRYENLTRKIVAPLRGSKVGFDKLILR